MRILHLIPETLLGGAESFGFLLSSELARRGHQVLLLSTYANGPLFKRERPAGMEVAALDRRGRLDPRIGPFLVGSIRRFRPEILHGHNFAANSWLRMIGTFFPHIPVVCHEHSGKKIHQPRSRYIVDRVLYRRCAAVFAVSRELYDLLARRYRIPASVLHYLPNGIEVDRYAEPPGTKRNPMEVVCVANLSRVKNHAGLLRTWRDVVRAYPEASLTLVGGGRLGDALGRQTEEDGISGSVEFAGFQEDVRPFLWRASVFVLPSIREGLPLSVLEAMAAGLPCVVSAVGEIPEIIEDGRTGRLIPAGDEDALATALRSVLGEPEKAGEMGRRAREVVARRHGIRSCVDAIEKVYRDLMG